MRAECRDELGDARRRLTSLIEIVRWIWVVNAVVMLIGAYFGRADLAALAGFTWLLSLVSTGMARKLVWRLGGDSEPAAPKGAQEGEP